MQQKLKIRYNIMEKEMHQLYLVTQDFGIVKINEYIATFKDGTAYTVPSYQLKDKETLKIKIGHKIHLAEYLSIIEPVGLNDAKLIEPLPCPQCISTDINIINNDVTNVVHCSNCPLGVVHPELKINDLITIWNNIIRRQYVGVDK